MQIYDIMHYAYHFKKYVKKMNMPIILFSFYYFKQYLYSTVVILRNMCNSAHTFQWACGEFL